MNPRIYTVKEFAEILGVSDATIRKVEALCLLDVLENDARLREIYITIVKEMAIKYGA
ncbi:hypothetical protein [Alkaliphilus sp. B6464]|uniref:hypothetical protein n=1 Tax=Alkaliphilus sp. B6464 TaxID=2731219 RepID=UPI001BA47E23|nr:hypothetical protein [Alkaliphilus sp. B6464]QUH20247.1 hypothetical protein HYG84_10235 [Alkaliphilus sp. B6464]